MGTWLLCYRIWFWCLLSVTLSNRRLLYLNGWGDVRTLRRGGYLAVVVLMVIIWMIFEGYFLVLKLDHNRFIYRCLLMLLSHLMVLIRAYLILVGRVRSIRVMLVPHSTRMSFYLWSRWWRSQNCLIKCLVDIFEETRWRLFSYNPRWIIQILLYHIEMVSTTFLARSHCERLLRPNDVLIFMNGANHSDFRAVNLCLCCHVLYTDWILLLLEVLFNARVLFLLQSRTAVRITSHNSSQDLRMNPRLAILVQE